MPDQRPFFRPLDAIVLIAVVAGAAWGLAAFRVAEGARAFVFLGGAKYGWYDLAGPKHTVAIPTGIGEVRAEFGEGCARVQASPCPNQLCVKTGAVRRDHAEIACLPARLLIVVESGRDAAGTPDAVTY